MNTRLIKYLPASFISIVMLFGFNVEKINAAPIEGIHTRYGIYGDPPEQYQFRDIPESVGYLTGFPIDLITKSVGAESLKNINMEYWVYTSVADAEMAVVEHLDWDALLLNNMIDSPLDKGLIGDNCWHTIKETGSVMFIRNNVFVYITPTIYPQFDPVVIEQIAREIDSILTKAPKVNVRSEIHSPTINSVDIESSYPKDITDFVSLKVDAVDAKYTKIHFRIYSFPRSFESETGYLTAYFNKNMYVPGDTTKVKVKIWVWNDDHVVSSIEQIIPF